MTIHVVKPGESVYSIAQLYRVTPIKIISDNELENPAQLVIGQTLVILDTPKTINFGSIQVNGYAFPDIDMDVLNKTLPNLTYLSIFSYQANSEGNLKTIADEPLIKAARAAGVAPMMVVTNLKEAGGFDSDIAHDILSSENVQKTLIDNIVATLKAKDYFGLDIDFEYVYPYDRERYNDFLRKVSSTIRPMGYQLTTAVAPKIAANQQGKLYEAHDYPVHGALADHVIIMTYEWGFTYGPPMAVSPANSMRRVLNYAVTEIPRNKIFMGIPNYGYDWKIPYQPGTAARTLSNTGAVRLAWEKGANIRYNTVSQAPFYNYYESNGQQHEVWFDDARSILAKLTIANQFRVGGISYWTIGKYFPQNWLVFNSVYKATKVL